MAEKKKKKKPEPAKMMTLAEQQAELQRSKDPWKRIVQPDLTEEEKEDRRKIEKAFGK